MTARDVILFALLIAVGAYRFHFERQASRRHLWALGARQREVATTVASLSLRHRALRAEAKALRSDPYYVERTLREQYGWRPPRRPAEAAPPVEMPTLAEPGGELASVVPGLEPPPPRTVDPPRPVQPGPAEPVQPSPPEPPQPEVDPDRALLERLGYTSVAHFQRKMTQAEPTGELDAATRRRIRQMAALLRRVGYTSVKDFQRAYALTVDGIYGRRTEQAVIRALRQARSIVVENGHSGDGNGG